MPGCATRCTTFSRTSIQAAWEDIRGHFGPRVEWSTDSGTIPATDVALWNAWATSKGIALGDVTRFGKWLIWYLSYGTVEYGNLPTRIRDHVGISCIPCPYDLRSDATRTRIWLGLAETDPLPTQSDHTVSGEGHYMKVSQRGNIWGFECTDPNCPYLISNGQSYFHA
jgi:hypothetical protein